MLLEQLVGRRGVKEYGSLWAWGDNECGEFASGSTLGLNDKDDRSSPSQIGNLNTWKNVTGDTKYSLAVKVDGTLWEWGYEELVNIPQTIKSSPIQIGSDTDWNKVYTSKSDGRIAYAIKTDATAWGWGFNNGGELGLNNIIARSSPVQIGPYGYTWKQIGPGKRHTCAISTGGELWWIGGGDARTIYSGKSSPVQIGSNTNWSQITCGEDYTLAIKTDGTLWGMGKNGSGQLGDETNTDSTTLKQIGGETNWKYIDTNCYLPFTLAIKTNNTLWAWGDNTYGQLGQNDTDSRSSPVQIGSDIDWKTISVGAYFGSYAIKENGSLWVWGTQSEGQLGDEGNTIAGRSTPHHLSGSNTWIKIYGGYQSTWAIKLP